MLNLGQFNTLYALRRTTPGMFLGEEDGDEGVLLPNKYVADDLKPGDSIEVFLHTDSEDRVVATTRKPKILLHHFATLTVNDVTRFGAFLDWGLEKDLFLPFAEQKGKVQPGDKVTVFLLLDDQTDRLVASAKIERYTEEKLTVKKGEEVDLLIDRRSDLGYRVIINNKYIGLVFANEVFQPLRKGDKVKGYIKEIREDGKINVSLQKQGYSQITDTTSLLLSKLQENDGVLHLTDKSDPALITQQLQMSKKAFKKSLGALYRQRKIIIKEDCITLCNKP